MVKRVIFSHFALFSLLPRRLLPTLNHPLRRQWILINNRDSPINLLQINLLRLLLVTKTLLISLQCNPPLTFLLLLLPNPLDSLYCLLNTHPTSSALLHLSRLLAQPIQQAFPLPLQSQQSIHQVPPQSTHQAPLQPTHQTSPQPIHQAPPQPIHQVPMQQPAQFQPHRHFPYPKRFQAHPIWSRPPLPRSQPLS